MISGNVLSTNCTTNYIINMDFQIMKIRTVTANRCKCTSDSFAKKYSQGFVCQLKIKWGQDICLHNKTPEAFSISAHKGG